MKKIKKKKKKIEPGGCGFEFGGASLAQLFVRFC